MRTQSFRSADDVHAPNAPFSKKDLARATLFAFAWAFSVVPVHAKAASCSCRHLESIQQEIGNTEALIDLQRDISDKLEAIEAPLIEAKKNPRDPDSDVNIYDRSLRARSRIISKFKLPHAPAKGYTGPAEVKMSFGSCEQSASDLEKLEAGSQCKELADINLAHESAHRAECRKSGATEYWKRLPSKMAAEEVARYTEQLAKLRELLRKVHDAGDVIVEAHMEPRIKGPQFDVTYSYQTGPIKLKGKSSSGSDRWSLHGNGVQIVGIGKMRIAGMNCTSAGQTTTQIDFSMETDGLTMTLKGNSKSAPGDIKVQCHGGRGMSMRPQGEMGSVQYFADQEVSGETNISRDVNAMDFGKILARGGLSVTGAETIKVKLICPGA
ncbi:MULTISPECIES: hypothetical protein [unclassified Rhizobium]|uniref:hypothetical protein n=1 Tax=unclassified Rhizobium TaxID=2613769 RepID=UPI00382CA5A2